MGLILLSFRVALALVRGRAALAKLSDRAHFRTALGGFGVPRPLVAALAAALPPVELAVGAMLLVSAASRAAALAAASLLGIFTLAVAAALLMGRRPSCGCFGGQSPIGPHTLVRNVLLLGAAVAVLAFGTGKPTPLPVEATAAGALVLAVLLRAAFRLLQLRGQALLRQEALEEAAAEANAAPGAAPIGAAIVVATLGTAGTAAAHPADDLETLRSLIESANPELLHAATRTRARIKAQKPSLSSAARRAAGDALTAERKQLLDLRTSILALQIQDPRAENARRLAAQSIALFAASISRVQAATTLPPKPAFAQLEQARALLQEAIYWASRVGWLLQP